MNGQLVSSPRARKQSNAYMGQGGGNIFSPVRRRVTLGKARVDGASHQQASPDKLARPRSNHPTRQLHLIDATFQVVGSMKNFF